MNRRFFLFVSLALLVLQSLFVVGYVTREHTFYFWDHAMYYSMAQDLFAAFRISFSQGLGRLIQSLSGDYNCLFALPSVIGFTFFGVSRLAFIIANFFVYFLAFELALAFVLLRTFRLAWPQALALGFGVCSLMPPLWIPLLQGYPDVGALALFTFALGVTLTGSMKSRSALLLSLLAGGSFLLRRHFAYPVLALLLTKGVFDFYAIVWRAPRGKKRRALWLYVQFYGMCGFVLLGVVALVAPAFFLKVLTTDYNTLYLSYQKPLREFLVFALSRFGVFLTLAGGGGYALAFHVDTKSRRALGLIGGTTLVCLVMWCAGPAQVGDHHLLHVLPLFLAVGLAGLLAPVQQYGKRRAPIFFSTVLFCALAANSAWALWFSPAGYRVDDLFPVRFLSAAQPPPKRNDYDQLVLLASHLANSLNPEDSYYVVGSSYVFNQDILRAAYTDALQTIEPVRQMVFGPEIDSRKMSPLSAFASANVYVVADPPQYHLDPKGQTVVTAVAQQFPPSQDMVTLFHADSEEFALEGGVKVRLWRRKPWTPVALHNALTRVRQITPAAQQDWVALTPLSQAFVGPPVSNQTDVIATLDAHRPELELFFDRAVQPGDYELRFNVNVAVACRDMRFVLTAVTRENKTLIQKTFSPGVVPGPVVRSFSLMPPRNEPAFLRLRLKSRDNSPCAIALQKLTIQHL